MTLVLVLLVAMMFASSASAGGVPRAAQPERRAEEVFGRLVAPCCWNQTLDIHDSELATVLRAEVATRLRAGEAASLIEDDLALRYGERIRAVPRGIDTRTYVGISVFAGMATLLIALCMLAQRWVLRGRLSAARDHASAQLAENDDNHYDDALDRELEQHRTGR